MGQQKGTVEQEPQIVARVPVDLHEAVKRRAEADDLSMAQLVRRALRQYVEEPSLKAS